MVAKKVLVRILTLAILLIAFGGSAEAGSAKAGTALPAFSGESLDGNLIDSKEYEGKVLLLDFWAISCSACLKAMPHIIELHEKYKEKGFAVLGVDVDRSKKRVLKILKKMKLDMPYPSIFDNDSKIKSLMGVSMLPTTILVDTKGVVQHFEVGSKRGFEELLEAQIKELLPTP